MSYHYGDFKGWLATDEGKAAIAATLAKARDCIEESGAVISSKLMLAPYDTWQSLACMDYLCEIGMMREVVQAGTPMGQYRVFARPYRG